MKIDIFNGFKRISQVLMVIWFFSAVAYGFLNPPSQKAYLYLDDFGASPVVSDRDECAPADAQDTFFSNIENRLVFGHVCFRSRPASDGSILVPYKIGNDPGSVWMDAKDSRNVKNYTTEYTAALKLSPDQAQALDALYKPARRQHLLETAAYALLGVGIIFLITTVIGWIARGFIKQEPLR